MLQDRVKTVDPPTLEGRSFAQYEATHTPLTQIDKYEILGVLGQGGMGTVYKALHPQFKKYVAIKEIRPELAQNPDIQQRFAQETELLAQLPPHPNIVMVRDALVYNDRLFLVMDYIEGGTLADLISGQAIEPTRAIQILTQILSGLEAIHHCGIVHHDLKASNILFDRDGNAYISDFGIAQYQSDLPTTATQPPVMASARYAAPEIIDPALASNGHPYQSDLYAVGILAYEMLLGEKRFREQFAEIYRGTAMDAAREWLKWHSDFNLLARNLNDVDPQIPKPLAHWVERLMAKPMNERYKDAGQAKRDITAITEQSPLIPRAADNVTMPLEQIKERSRDAPPAKLPLPLPARPTPPLHVTHLGATPTAPIEPFPRWAWWAGGAMAMVALIMLILVFLLPTEPGFTLLVQGAPAASDVYVDNIRRGMVAADGTITVHHLKAGKRLVSVAHEGCTEFNTAISGNDGENRAVLAQLTKIAAAQVTPQTLPPTIEYTGTMILIPAGEFIMGDDTHLANEKPAHKVTLPDYYIDKFEVTNAQYKKFCDETARTRPTNPWWDEQYFSRYPDAPIVGISWYDAAAYAKWAGKRLATEAEWEKAASWDVANNKKRIWPWGDNFLPDRTNTNSNHPTPINQFASGTSSYGVEDMAGNAAEWVDSIYQAYPGNTAYDKEFDSSYRVVRGGSFRSTADDVRTTRRFFHAPEFKADEKKDRSWLIGFRCVVSATDAKLQEFLRGRANQ